MKLNRDGSVLVKFGQAAACGGLIRGSNGNFITGFACNLGPCTIMQAELYGLTLGRSKGFQRILIDSDSHSAIHFINNDCNILHPCASIVQDIQILINQFFSIKWAHAYREANSCADILANLGHSVSLGAHIFLSSATLYFFGFVCGHVQNSLLRE